METRLRWLVVVDRSRPGIYQDLRARFDGWAFVIMDRRKGVSAPAHSTERRRPITSPEKALWQCAGYRFVYQTDGFELHEYVERATRPSRASGSRRRLPPSGI